MIITTEKSDIVMVDFYKSVQEQNTAKKCLTGLHLHFDYNIRRLERCVPRHLQFYAQISD